MFRHIVQLLIHFCQNAIRLSRIGQFKIKANPTKVRELM